MEAKGVKPTLTAQTAVPGDAVFSATDPLGMTVFMTKATQDGQGTHSVRHPELQDTDTTREAIEDPQEIARHTEFPDRRLYLGKPRDPGDIALAPIRRLVITAVRDTSTAEVITTYDHGRSRKPATMGATLYDAVRASTKDATGKS